MKKLGGIFCALIILCCGFLFNVAATVAPASFYSITNVDSLLSHNGQTISGGNGVFIRRDADIDKSTDETARFEGTAYCDPSRLPESNTKFQLTAVMEHNGVWYTAPEYYSQVLNVENVSGVADWFEINEGIVNHPYLGSNTPSVTWALRKKSPAGRYAINAKVVKIKHIEHPDGTVEENYEDWDDFEFRGDYDPFEYRYIILYGDALQNINCVDTTGSSVYNVRQRGLNTEITVYTSTNPGAMRLDDMYEFVVQEVNGIIGGELSVSLDINSWQFEVSLEKDGKKITTFEEGAINFEFIDGGIKISLPKTLAAGQYIAKIYHESSPEIIGTYVIDNGLNIPNDSNASRIMGMVFLIIGVLGLLLGLFLYAAPKVIYNIQQVRYKTVEDKVYQKDKRSVKIREKEAKEAEANTPVSIKTTGRGFLRSLSENRMKREAARELGMTLEEFREIEKKREIQETAKEHSLSEIRGFSGPEMVKEEKTIKPKTADGEPEFELLESVREEAVFADEEFVQNVVQPNVIHGENEKEEEKNDEKPKSGLPHQLGGMLSRIRKLTEENE